MHILLDYRPALRDRTGVGQYAHGLAAALQAAGGPEARLTLFSSSWKDRLAADAVPGAGRADLRIPVRVLNTAWHRLEWPPAEWLAGAVDVTHSLHPLMMPSRRAARVVTIHDLFFLDYPEQTTAEVRRDYARLAPDHARRAEAVIVPSAYTRDAVVERLGVESGRIAVCPPGAPDWPPRQAPPEGGPILFLGTVEPRKNLSGLLKAYASLVRSWPETPPLVIAGKAGAVASLMPADDSRLLEDRVRWTGYVTEAEKLDLYRRAVLLVLPSLDEGFGLPALEAMTLGVPVVAARRGALPEVLGEAAVFVEPDAPDSIATAIRAVAGQPALRARLVAAGLRGASRFRWASSAAGVLDAYRDAIARRRHGV